MTTYVGGIYQVYYKNKNYRVSQLAERVSLSTFIYVLWDTEFNKIYRDLEIFRGVPRGGGLANSPEEWEYIKEYLISKWG